VAKGVFERGVPEPSRNEHGFAELCFQCDCWFNDSSEWERHCQEHLDKPEELLRCDPLIFRNFPVKPGYCCFCLGNTRQSASKRMEQYVTDRSKWYDHIEGHLNKLGCDFSCSHPACCVEFGNIKDLRHHLVDCSLLPTSSWTEEDME
jgi:hypothetical protein